MFLEGLCRGPCWELTTLMRLNGPLAAGRVKGRGREGRGRGEVWPPKWPGTAYKSI